MSDIKDILDKIDKLSPADQERLKTILFSKTFIKLCVNYIKQQFIRSSCSSVSCINLNLSKEDTL